MTQKASVLVVEDDLPVGTVLRALLQQAGYAAEHVESGESALKALQAQRFDLVITDLKMDGMSGMDLLRALTVPFPWLPVVVLTAHGTVATAVEAMQLGAADFLLKPFEHDDVLFTVDTTLKRARAKRERPPVATAGQRLIGESEAMRVLQERISRVAQSDATVLLLGETGTGKELAARMLQELGPRQGKPFITVNCGALPEGLLESELFGHERGAFTGAVSRKPGRVELAHEGTLFLDEVGDLPPPTQVKLLRFLQDREYTPVGGTAARTADVRVIAATHRDLQSMAEQREFRQDLLYRLHVVPVRLPALRERRHDIPLLAQHFCRQIGEQHRGVGAVLSEGALACLQDQPWPGNVRELQNLIERLVVLGAGAVITEQDVERELHGSTLRDVPDEAPAPELDRCAESLEASRTHAERASVAAALEQANGNRTLAARLLGVSRRTLYNKLAEHGLR